MHKLYRRLKQFKMDHIFLIINVLTNIILFSLGVYFIHVGEVVQRFQIKRTNFAVYKEKMVEYPTIILYLFPWTDSLVLGKDFNITFHEDLYEIHQGINLTLGENVVTVENSTLRLHFGPLEQWFLPNIFKLKIQNYQPSMPINHALTFVFNDPNLSTHQAGFQLTTENGTMDCGNGKFYDGDVNAILSTIGKWNGLTIHPQKYIYQKENCRNEPYIEEINQYVDQKVFQDCNNPCKPKEWTHICFSLGLSKVFSQLPTCETREDSDCFIRTFNKAKSKVIDQPCTKVQYHVQNNPFKDYHGYYRSKTVFQMAFATPHVTVNEEYLIYDIVAVVSAIGGTMGLCIGISFRDVSNFIGRYAKLVIQWMKPADERIGDMSMAPHHPELFAELKCQIDHHEKLLNFLQKKLELQATSQI